MEAPTTSDQDGTSAAAPAAPRPKAPAGASRAGSAPRGSPAKPVTSQHGSSSAATDKPHVFTNEDLLKYALPQDSVNSASAENAKTQQEAFEKDALGSKKREDDTQAYLAKLRQNAEDRVNAALQQVEQLRWVEQWERNPLSAPPPIDDEEKKQIASLSASDRLRKTQEQLAAAERELEAARANLRQVQRQLAEAR